MKELVIVNLLLLRHVIILVANGYKTNKVLLFTMTQLVGQSRRVGIASLTDGQIWTISIGDGGPINVNSRGLTLTLSSKSSPTSTLLL